MARTTRLLVAVLTVAIGIGMTPAAALDGDAMFLPGRITTDFDGGEDSVAALAMQSDGRVLAVGTATVDGASRFAVARYLPGGVLDPTFSGDGKATALVGTWSVAKAAGLQSDGKLVVAGMAIGDSDIAGQFALARFLPDGRVDTTFGTAGAVMTNFDGLPRTDIVHAMAIQPDGKVVVAGSTPTGMADDTTFALARYLPDGSLDPTFDGDGKLTSEFGPGLDTAHALALQPDGKIVVAGRGTWCGPTLIRYLPDGRPDPTFTPSNSERRTSGLCDARGVALDGDGNILITGGTAASELGVARYRPDGTSDPSFGRRGEVATPIGRQAGASAIAIQPNGKIIAAGVADIGSDRFRYTFAITRYHRDGSLDRTFDLDGIAVTDFTAYTDEAFAVTITSTGQIVAAGQAGFTSREGSDFAIVGLSPPLVDAVVNPPVVGGTPPAGSRPDTTSTTVASRPAPSSTSWTARPTTTSPKPRVDSAPAITGLDVVATEAVPTRHQNSEKAEISSAARAGVAADQQAPEPASEAKTSLTYTPVGNRRGLPETRTVPAAIAALAALTVAAALWWAVVSPTSCLARRTGGRGRRREFG